MIFDSDPASNPLRVVSVAHTAVRHASGRKRYEPLLRRQSIALKLIVPDRWFEDGLWIEADPPHGSIVPELHRIRLPRAGPASWYLHYYPRLRQVIRSFRPSVIHLWEEPWSLVAAQAVWLRNRIAPDASIVLEVDQNVDRRLPPPFEAIRRYTLANTDHLLGRQPEAVEVARAHGYRGDATLVEYGCDHDVFHPEGRPEARQRLGVNGFTIGCVGRLVPQKGIDDVIRAIARCPAPVQLMIIGWGPERDPLAELADRLGLGDRVRFFPAAPPTDVAQFMRALDIVVLMTRSSRTYKEQFGRVIMEAQACGVPVIGSTSGSIPDVIGAGGWIVPERNPDALAACLERLANDPAAVAATAFAARSQALQRYTYETVADALWHGYTAAACARAASLQVKSGRPLRPARTL